MSPISLPRICTVSGILCFTALNLLGLKPVQAVGFSAKAINLLSGGATNLGFGLNNLGDVVGQADNSLGQSHAFLYDGTHSVDLGTFAAGNAGQSFAFGINDQSQVVGYAALSSGGSYHAFLDNNGVKQDLSTLGGADSVATGINNQGTIVGYSTTGSGDVQAFRSLNGGPLSNSDGRVGETSRAYGISNDGTTVGEATNGAGTATSAYSSAHTFSPFLGAGDNSVAYATTNVKGTEEAVGQLGGSSKDAFTFTNHLTDLGTLAGYTGQSIAFGVNGKGEVVGESDSLNNVGDITGSHAFLFTGQGALIDLNSYVSPSFKYILNDATAINASGQILVNGTLKGGTATEAFLLTPQAVPEFSTFGSFGLMLLGIPALRLIRKRRSQS